MWCAVIVTLKLMPVDWQADIMFLPLENVRQMTSPSLRFLPALCVRLKIRRMNDGAYDFLITGHGFENSETSWELQRVCPRVDRVYCMYLWQCR